MTEDLINRVTYYLSSGGLFNPELADHLAVRNLLMECREALAQPEQEPVADINIRPSPHGGLGIAAVLSHKLPVGSWLLYTTPPQRKPLTDEQKDRLANAWFSKDGDTDVSHRKAIALIEEVEAAHGIKELV